MHLDVADQPGARGALRDAFRLAQESEDLAVCSWAMAMNALLETWLGNTAVARAYGHAAVGIAAGGPRLVQAFAQGKLARALAAAGNRDGALTALTAARSLFDIGAAARGMNGSPKPSGTVTATRTFSTRKRTASGTWERARQSAPTERPVPEPARDGPLPQENRAFATGNRALSLARLEKVEQACDSTLSLLQLAATLQCRPGSPGASTL